MVEYIPDDGFQDLPKGQQVLLVGGVLTIIGVTLWGMKKISESARKVEISWKDFLFSR